jgi:hypothetical protein
MIEPLEDRRLLSASLTFTAGLHNLRGIRVTAGHTLQIWGTSRSEAIYVSEVPASRLGEIMVAEAPLQSKDATRIRGGGFDIKGLIGRGGGVETFSIPPDANAQRIQTALAGFDPPDSMYIQSARRGVVDRWLISADLVNQIVVEAGGGNDRVGNGAYGPTTLIERPVTLLGGSGEDLLTTGGNSNLFGGSGNDLLVDGGAYLCNLYGGPGNDGFMNSWSEAQIDGGSGHDLVNGMQAGYFTSIEQFT